MVKDEPDGPDCKNGVRMEAADGRKFIIIAPNPLEKHDWLACLTSSATTRLLAQMLQQRIKEYEAALPSLVPDARVYPFAQEDSPNNVRFESSSKVGGGGGGAWQTGHC